MESYEELRPYLFAIACRRLGSVAEAEHVVQDDLVHDVEAGGEAGSRDARRCDTTHTPVAVGDGVGT